MDRLGDILEFTWKYLLHLTPWFLLAVVLGIVANLFALDILARRAFTKHGVLAIVATTAIGAFSPFCSFTVIPLIRRFLAVGVPLSAVMAFWVASPSMDPEIFGLSAAQLGMPIALARLLGALALSLAAGFIVLAFEKRGHLLDPLRKDVVEEAAAPSCRQVPVAAGAGDGPGAPASDDTRPSACDAAVRPEPTSCGATPTVVDDGAPWWPMVRKNLREANPVALLKEAWGDTIRLGKWFLLALIADAVIVFYLPGEVIANTVGGGLLSILVAALVSFPLYVNGVGAIPIVDGLLIKGMDAGAAVTFLLAGAVSTIPAMAAVRSIVNWRVFSVYLGVGFFGSVIIGYLSWLWL
ncbi:hypothetical protein GCM10022243_15950 [Saccharothrix violaceirubra]|uniref:Permease n=1 Tax=Saccharothrix violaceirubra TaxID=413306 RepID=A0A7W7WXT0_9PSEU|nr:permease [Saccharothrix violaceirubra]MBB4967472.1 hypothetical protein [Saccharothrix violaceirubra]